MPFQGESLNANSLLMYYPQPVQPYMYIRGYKYLCISFNISCPQTPVCSSLQMFACHWPARAEAGRMRSICCCLDIGRPVASRTCNIPHSHSIFPHTSPHNAVRNTPHVWDVWWCMGGVGVVCVRGEKSVGPPSQRHCVALH